MTRKYEKRKRRNNIKNGFEELKIELDFLKINKEYSYLEIITESIKYIKELQLNINILEYETFHQHLEYIENKIF
jgi:hypothetical protein